MTELTGLSILAGMKWILIGIAPTAALLAQANPLADERVPVAPMVLPDVPSVAAIDPEFSDKRSPRVSQPDLTGDDAGVPLDRRTEILYQRKKIGEASLLLRSNLSALVKVIDLDTRRLECFLWMENNGVIELRGLPESRYKILFAQEVRLHDGGRLTFGWLGEVEETIDLTRPRARETISLSFESGARRVIAGSFEDWKRFNAQRPVMSQ